MDTFWAICQYEALVLPFAWVLLSYHARHSWDYPQLLNLHQRLASFVFSQVIVLMIATLHALRDEIIWLPLAAITSWTITTWLKDYPTLQLDEWPVVKGFIKFASTSTWIARKQVTIGPTRDQVRFSLSRWNPADCVVATTKHVLHKTSKRTSRSYLWLSS